MGRPDPNTKWPTGSDLREWLPDGIGSAANPLADDLVAEATTLLLEKCDANLLPEDVDQCPRFLARAIIQQAQHMLAGRQASGGIVMVGDTTARIPALAPGVAAAIRSLRLEAEA